MKQKNKKIDWSFLSKIKEIKEERFNQDEGDYIDDEPCCFGAHLANVLIQKDDFIDGLREFKKRLGGINDAQVLLLFRQAGLKTNNPFSSEEWNLTVKDTIENLEKIEKVPETRGADLRYAELSGVDLLGVDFEDADLRGANLSYTNLRSANLKGVDLEGANFWGADLRYADLRYANLDYALLYDAKLQHANLRGADLSYVNLYGVDLKGVDLRNIKRR